MIDLNEINLDMEGVEYEDSPVFTVPDTGTYRAEITDVDVSKSKKGNAMLVVDWQITEGEFTGARVRQWAVLQYVKDGSRRWGFDFVPMARYAGAWSDDLKERNTMWAGRAAQKSLMKVVDALPGATGTIDVEKQPGEPYEVKDDMGVPTGEVREGRDRARVNGFRLDPADTVPEVSFDL